MSFHAEGSAETAFSAGTSDPTLQDFVLNLINDEAAKAAYLADPTAALGAAGLSDLTAVDVQEVLPLIADSLPEGLPADLSALPVDVPALDSLPVAVPELGDLTGGLPVAVPELGNLTGGLPVAVPEVGDLAGGLPAVPALGDLTGALPVGVPELDDLTGGLPVELPSLPTIDTPVGDVTAVADSVSGLAGVDLDTDALSSSTASLLSNADEGGAPTLSSHTETVLGDVAAGAKLAPEEFGGSVAGATPLADFGGGVVGHVGGEYSAWGGADTVLGDVAVGALASQDGLALAAESPVADLALNSNGDFSVEPGNLNDLLDIDNLGDTGDAVAGTVAHVFSTGTDAVAGGVETGTDALGGYLTGWAGPIANTVDDLSGTVTDGIQGGGDMVSEHLTNLPTTDALPLDQLPELPQLPDVPAVNSNDLPQVTDVTSHLPVDVPDVQLPDTSGVTDLVTSPVNDIAGSTPLGGTVDDVTGHLSQVTDQLGNLNLGL